MARRAAEKLTEVISMRLSERDKKLLDSAAASAPFIPRLTLARFAMRIGLEKLKKKRSMLKAIAGLES